MGGVGSGEWRTLRQRGGRLMRGLALTTVAAFLAGAQIALAAPVVYDFTVAPAVPVAGETATFTASGLKGMDTVRWDFDNDGVFDATGAGVQHVFATTGQRIVLMRVTTEEGETKDVVKSVRVDPAPAGGVPAPPPNQPPSASFTIFPDQAFAGAAILFASTSSDPDGPLASQTWDLDGDGLFDDASGPTAARAFSVPGWHRVSLRVTDGSGAADVASQSVLVLARAPGQLGSPTPGLALMSPFPIVRIAGSFEAWGATVRLLAVRNAPRGARVTVRCRGRGCPVRSRSRSMPSGRMRLRFLERRLRAGVVIRIFVTRRGTIGKYTSFRIRRGRPPLRSDRCVLSPAAGPQRCPSS